MQKLDFDKRMDLINEVTERILAKGIVTEREKAEEIARRWIKY